MGFGQTNLDRFVCESGRNGSYCMVQPIANRGFGGLTLVLKLNTHFAALDDNIQLKARASSLSNASSYDQVGSNGDEP